MEENIRVNIVGAGLSGLSAAITLARSGISSNLISVSGSERAQSVLAEGGINAALDTMGENDSVRDHFEDTMKGGCFLESESSIKNLTENAAETVTELVKLGVPFNFENGKLILRNFGGQKKKRTAYCKSSTGKMIMTALIDEARKYEVEGLINRFCHHELVDVSINEDELESITIKDIYTEKLLNLYGPAVMCCGGLNGFFEGMTTGTMHNTGNAAAVLFCAGVEFADLEFIQYHPTTVGIADKRMLVSEAARGEGGRLYFEKDGHPFYFMEEKYPELKNLMPRDVISREMAFIEKNEPKGCKIYLDMTGIQEDVWSGKLSDLRKEIKEYLGKDPADEPIPVSPGIHFFMGGIKVNDAHETNIKGLFAAGEAACKYHGANRLGGNSLLGAVYGGKTAGESALVFIKRIKENKLKKVVGNDGNISNEAGLGKGKNTTCPVSSPICREKLKEALLKGLGIIRDLGSMQEAYDAVLSQLKEPGISEIDEKRAYLGLAMLKSAMLRKESRGAHYRTDFPKEDEGFKKMSMVCFKNKEVSVTFKKA